MSTIKIAVASGKGGTGKTMVASSLAACLDGHVSVQFLDCDVEAPNAHLFLKPEIESIQPAVIRIPEIDQTTCTACGKCVDICEFNALAQMGEEILLFPQLCHGCGSCQRVCPENAIHETPRKIGNLRFGMARSKIRFLTGDLTISEPMPTPIIRQLKSHISGKSMVTILDSPPGASCAVVATVHDADFVILVTEPTPFGLHDLKQMLGVLEQTGSPGGVIINRVGIGDVRVEDYLEHTSYPVMMKIPYLAEIAVVLAKGEVFSDKFPKYQAEFLDLFQEIKRMIKSEQQVCG